MIDKEAAAVFRSFIEGNEDALLVKKLYSYCIKIAEASVWAKYGKAGNDLRRMGITCEDLAHDAVSPLFLKNTSGITVICNSYLKWNKKIEDDAEIDFFLHRVVWKSLEQRVASLYKETDPFFAKIIKTVSAGIDGLDYKKVYHFGTAYILRADLAEISGPVINQKEFNCFPSSLFLNRQKKLFDGLTSYIEKNTSYFPAIPLNLLVKRIKEINLSEELRLENADDFDLIELNDIINNAKHLIKEKIKNTYRAKGKLSEDETGKIVKIFEDISADLRNGGMHLNIMDYYEKVFGDTCAEIYYTRYQKILSYLYNIYREEISSGLK